MVRFEFENTGHKYFPNPIHSKPILLNKINYSLAKTKTKLMKKGKKSAEHKELNFKKREKTRKCTNERKNWYKVKKEGKIKIINRGILNLEFMVSLDRVVVEN